jgi:2-polyprenyl-6-methoxyphenol hydroxylase-like FAD-dependent oxidoreductase
MWLMKTDVCIRGAGVVGQALALLLARSRIRVQLLSTSASTAVDLRSYALNTASRRLLTDLRVWPDQATPVQAMRVWGDTQGQIEFDARDQPLAWIVDAQDLQAALSQAIRFAPEIVMAENAAAEAQLTVICEGRMSPSRDALDAGYERFAYDQSAIAAHLECEVPHNNTAFQWMRTDQICALLPRGESQMGNSMALVWSVPHEFAQALETMPPTEFESALEGATQCQLGKLKLASARARWPLSIAQAQNWCGLNSSGSWVLAGDAAHAMHPLAGQGLNLGLGDAVALAGALASRPYFRNFDDMRLLRGYERERKADAAMLLMATDGLHRVFSHTDTRMQALRNLGMKAVDGALPLKAWLMRQASGQR